MQRKAYTPKAMIITTLCVAILLLGGLVLLARRQHAKKAVQRNKDDVTKAEQKVKKAAEDVVPPSKTNEEETKTKSNHTDQGDIEPKNQVPPQNGESQNGANPINSEHLDTDTKKTINIIRNSDLSWRAILEKEMKSQLMIINKYFGEAEENGDCFFDAVAQQLNRLRGENLSKRQVREAISNHLNQLGGPDFEKKYQQQQDEYQELCLLVGKCLEDFKEGEGAPCWGNSITAQIVADIYNVEVHVYASELFSISLVEGLAEGVYDGFNAYQTMEGGLPALRICTKIETDDETLIRFKPLKDTKDVIELANISYDVWGHWMPVWGQPNKGRGKKGAKALKFASHRQYLLCEALTMTGIRLFLVIFFLQAAV